jgi:hypothetical protein
MTNDSLLIAALRAEIKLIVFWRDFLNVEIAYHSFIWC